MTANFYTGNQGAPSSFQRRTYTRAQLKNFNYEYCKDFVTADALAQMFQYAGEVGNDDSHRRLKLDGDSYVDIQAHAQSINTVFKPNDLSSASVEQAMVSGAIVSAAMFMPFPSLSGSSFENLLVLTQFTQVLFPRQDYTYTFYSGGEGADNIEQGVVELRGEQSFYSKRFDPTRFQSSDPFPLDPLPDHLADAPLEFEWSFKEDYPTTLETAHPVELAAEHNVNQLVQVMSLPGASAQGALQSRTRQGGLVSDPVDPPAQLALAITV